MTFEEIVEKYSAKDSKLIEETVDELCKNGIAKGCYQDYSVLSDILSILTIFEYAVEERK